MALRILTSTLQALQTFQRKLGDVPSLSESQLTKTWPDRWKTMLRMGLISAAVGGIELCYSAETAFVSPLLLQLGVPVYLMTLCWMASPVLGFFLVPILGSASDTCTSRLGRRRPFIILYSIGILLGLVLVPYGKDIGELLGDRKDENTNKTVFQNMNSTDLNRTGYIYNPPPSESLATNAHPAGIIFTILGVVMLDFCSDGCQTPTRTLMIDLCSVADQTQGLAAFTVVAGIGGAIGYTVAGIKWNKETLTFPLDPAYSTHVHVVFGVVAVAFLICSLLTIFGVKEKALDSANHSYKYRRMYNCNPAEDLRANTIIISRNALKKSQSDHSLLKSSYGLSSEEISRSTNISHTKSVSALNDCKESHPPREEQTRGEQNGCDSPVSINNDCEPSTPSSWSSLDEDDMQVEQDGMKVFLKSIIFMPKHMWMLCLCNLFCWMSLVTYSLYFTDYVGQEIFNGVPNAMPNTIERALYTDGVRTGSLAMVCYSLSCTVYSLCIVKLIDKFGTRSVYVCGQLVYSIGMAALAITGHVVMAFVASLTAGLMYATLFTLPYILVARYHSDTEFSKLRTQDGELKRRGLGTDVAIVSSMVFAGQFILSLFIGTLIHAAGSTIVIPIAAAILSFCGAITAIKVEYVGK